MFRAYKMRIFPTEEQKVLIAKTFGCCRWYWNQALHDNIEYYKENGKGKITTPAKYKAENEWLKDVDSMALCNTQMDLQSAFSKFSKNQMLDSLNINLRKDLRTVIKQPVLVAIMFQMNILNFRNLKRSNS